MPTSETLERFIARVEQNAHVEAVEEFYTADASMQENNAAPRVGRDNHAANERKVMARALSVTSECVRPVLVNGSAGMASGLRRRRFFTTRRSGCRKGARPGRPPSGPASAGGASNRKEMVGVPRIASCLLHVCVMFGCPARGPAETRARKHCASGLQRA